MATITKIGEPARVESWGLAVGPILTQPAEYIVLRYLDDGRRHSNDYEVVVRFPFVDNADAAFVALVEKSGMPKGIAAQLVTQIAMKRASHKAAEADRWGRPVP